MQPRWWSSSQREGWMWARLSRSGLELLRERERGKAILLISAELEELMNLADRIAVMFEGRIVGILDAASVTQEKLGLMISGVERRECMKLDRTPCHSG